jgi:two-component system response regulator RegA
VSAAGSILLVDDDETFRERLGRALRERGFEVTTAASAAAGADAARAARFRYAVIDLRMPGASGLELVAALRERAPEMRVVVLTGYGSIASAVEAMHLGAHHYLSKPADADEIISALTTEGARPVPAPRPEKPPTLARTEWEHIQRVLADCAGNISEAARRLGITRRTLQLKLKKDPPRS